MEFRMFGEIFSRFQCGVALIDATARQEYRSSTLVDMLRAEPDRPRLEAELNRAIRRLLKPDETAHGDGMRLDPDPIEVRTRLACYRIIAGRSEPWIYGLLSIVTPDEQRTAAPRGDGRVVNGGVAFPEPRVLAERFRLTARECTVAELLARGLSNANIATTLGISPYTARRHTERILMKLHARSRAEVSAVLLGLDAAPR